MKILGPTTAYQSTAVSLTSKELSGRAASETAPAIPSSSDRVSVSQNFLQLHEIPDSRQPASAARIASLKEQFERGKLSTDPSETASSLLADELDELAALESSHG